MCLQAFAVSALVCNHNVHLSEQLLYSEILHLDPLNTKPSRKHQGRSHSRDQVEVGQIFEVCS